MNIHSDVIFANQADRTEKQVLKYEGHTATMITSDTRGVGKNRNIGLLYCVCRGWVFRKFARS